MSDRLAALRDSFGRAGSRYRLPTPALVLDLDRMEDNLARMGKFCDSAGIRLRPHAKSHKSVRIAKLQVAGGAIGICCATLGEAEIVAGRGIAGVMITSPVVGAGKIGRLAALNRRCQGLMVVADSPDNIAALEAGLAASGRTLAVLVDLDIGQRRTGATRVEAALDLADRIEQSPSLTFAGIQAYAGHLQHLEDYAARAAAASEAAERLRRVLAALEDRQPADFIITGVGTGTFDIDPTLGLFTEIQSGSYLFMDVEYSDHKLWRSGRPPFDNALFVQTTVISANHPGQATTDAGLKAFATDGPLPIIASGAPDGSSYRFTGDEFGCVMLPAGAELALGAVVECIVPHCDPTVNLHDAYHCVRGDVLVDIWPVDARGKY